MRRCAPISLFKNFIQDCRGVAIIETAIVTPILLILMFGMFEIGYYLVRQQIATRSLGVTAGSIQANPTAVNLQTIALNSGAGIIAYGSGGNFICAQSYRTAAAAAAGCAGATWNVTRPAGVAAGTAYFVAVRVSVPYRPLTPLASFISGFTMATIDQSVVVQVGASVATGPVSFTTTVGTISAQCGGSTPNTAARWQVNCGHNYCTAVRGYTTGHMVTWACNGPACATTAVCW